MPQLKCDKHGVVSPVFTSPHLARAVIKGEQIDKSKLKRVSFLSPDTKNASCLVDEDFLSNVSELDYERDEEDGFEFSCLLVPVCSTCFKDQTS